MFELKTEAHFDSAHFLTDYYGKCENLHGHRWKVVAYIQAESLGTSSTMKDMVVDFGVFKRAVREIADSLDHALILEEGSIKPLTKTCLVEEGFRLVELPFRTTAENLAKWFCEALCARNFYCVRVDMYETPLNCATYLLEHSAETADALQIKQAQYIRKEL